MRERNFILWCYLQGGPSVVYRFTGIVVFGFMTLVEFTYPTPATAIVTSCSAHRIIIATDGLSLQPDAYPPSHPGCKIQEGNPLCYFAIAGLQDAKDINYDLVPLARRACRQPGSLSDKAEYFSKIALPEIKRAWAFAKAKNPKAVATIRRSGAARWNVVFAGVQPLALAIVEYEEQPSGTISEKPMKVQVGTPSAPPDFTAFGNENILIYHQRHPDTDKLDDLGFVTALLDGAIQIEEQEPQPLRRIGPPTAVLQIDSTGASWIRQGACTAIKH
jgi:hypothetical protein